MEHLCDLGIISLERILLSTAFYIVMHSGLLHNPITCNRSGLFCSATALGNPFLETEFSSPCGLFKNRMLFCHPLLVQCDHHMPKVC